MTFSKSSKFCPFLLPIGWTVTVILTSHPGLVQRAELARHIFQRFLVIWPSVSRSIVKWSTLNLFACSISWAKVEWESYVMTKGVQHQLGRIGWGHFMFGKLTGGQMTLDRMTRYSFSTISVIQGLTSSRTATENIAASGAQYPSGLRSCLWGGK